MFNIGTQEMILILLVVLLLFGAKRIPEISRALGKGMADFRDAMSGVERELKGEPPPRAAAPGTLPPGTAPRNRTGSDKSAAIAPGGEQGGASTEPAAPHPGSEGPAG